MMGAELVMTCALFDVRAAYAKEQSSNRKLSIDLSIKTHIHKTQQAIASACKLALHQVMSLSARVASNSSLVW